VESLKVEQPVANYRTTSLWPSSRKSNVH